MKLTNEDKIKIYKLKQEGYSYKELSKKYKIRIENIKYLVKLAQTYGEGVLIKRKNKYYYPPLLKDKIKLYTCFA